MNNQNSQNDVYQTPSRSAEAFDVEPLGEADQPNSLIYTMEREVVSRALISPEISPMHGLIIELTQIGRDVNEYRTLQHAELIKKAQPKSTIGRLMMSLVSNGTAAEASEGIKRSIDEDSNTGKSFFPVDKDVTDAKFFCFPEWDAVDQQEIDVWHYDQTSLLPEKRFTISYKASAKRQNIYKSTTYFDPSLKEIVNRSSIPSQIEAENLLGAARNYYKVVTQKPYIRSAAPRFRFVKSDLDLAA
jgi:hypothetical protein